MFKILIILCIILYLLSKIGNLFFKAGAASQARTQQRRDDGSIHVDSAPKKGKNKGTIKGGDYVDYEEVK